MFNQITKKEMEKAIIKGEVVRFARVGNSVEFSLRVVETNLSGHTFTLGTVVGCVVRPKESGDILILHGHTMDTQSPGEPFRTASALTVKDMVVMEMDKTEDGWEVASIVHEADRGQDVNEYLCALEERLEEYKVKYPKSYF